MTRIRAHVVVEGLVQGVNYRRYMLRQAQFLGVAGWVRNRDDGNVEAVLEGDRDNVGKLIEWCKEGPSMAVVENVEVEEQAYTGEFHQFSITR